MKKPKSPEFQAAVKKLADLMANPKSEEANRVQALKEALVLVKKEQEDK